MNLDHLDLSKQELTDLLQLMHDALSVNTDDQLNTVLLQIQKFVPCENIIAVLGQTGLDGKLQGVAKLANISYSTDWLNNYLEHGYTTIDPILLNHFKTFQPQLWSETYKNATSKREQEFIEHAKSYGLSQGITLGQACKRNMTGSLFSFAGQDMGEHPRHQAVLTHLGPHLHLALMRAAFSSPDTPNLTSREREVLRWMMEGKTNWETSRILAISERTVKFHVQNILAKLHSSTRGHAIAQAMEQGLVVTSLSSLEAWLASLDSEDEISPNLESPLMIQR